MTGDVEIEDVRLLPNERLGLIHSDRKVVFDIYCRDKNGTDFIVEMQCARQTFFRDRALEESTELHSRKTRGTKSIDEPENLTGKWMSPSSICMNLRSRTLTKTK